MLRTSTPLDCRSCVIVEFFLGGAWIVFKIWVIFGDRANLANVIIDVSGIGRKILTRRAVRLF
jgi:hypothetical protein